MISKATSVELEKDKHFYRRKRMSNAELDILMTFLLDDFCGSKQKKYIEWILDGSEQEIFGLITELKKQKNNIIIKLDEIMGSPHLALVMSKEKLLSFLDQWQKVFEQKPKEIIITEIDGVYAVEGRD